MVRKIYDSLIVFSHFVALLVKLQFLVKNIKFGLILMWCDFLIDILIEIVTFAIFSSSYFKKKRSLRSWASFSLLDYFFNCNNLILVFIYNLIDLNKKSLHSLYIEFLETLFLILQVIFRGECVIPLGSLFLGEVDPFLDWTLHTVFLIRKFQVERSAIPN